MKSVIIITVLVVVMIMVSDAGKKKETGGRYKKCQNQLKTLQNENKDLESQIASQTQEIKKLQDKNGDLQNQIDGQVSGYSIVGCYKDTADRAIPIMEGSDDVLDGAYSSRANPIKKCAEAAKKAGHSMFAVQNGGQCAFGADAPKSFNKHGTSNACKDDGEGGWWANQVYIFNDYHKVGCYKDTSDRAITILEGSDDVLDGWLGYGTRTNPVEKCALAAMRAGNSMFAVQNGGQCASSDAAPQTYNKYGTSNACKDGEGGMWANQVYSFNSE